MRKPRWMAAVVMPTAIALAITSCSGDEGGDDAGGTTDNSKNDNATVSVYGSAPERPLVPGDTTETGGGKIVDALFTGLVEYDPVTSEPRNAHAQEIKPSEDGREMTFTLKEGWTFHDGTPVTADSYVKAWNYTAYGPNAQQGASFFAQVEGYAEVHPVDPDGEGPGAAPTPAVDTMSGLEVISENEFKVTFTDPHPIFRIKLGYPTFSPLPEAFYADVDGFGAAPIGNGPWKFEATEPDVSTTVARWDEYQGEDKGKIGKVQFQFLESTDAAYSAVVGNQLDFLDTIPPQGLAGNLWEQDLAGRSGSADILSIQIINFPLYDPKFTNVKFRQAISMAIDREAITETIFEGNRKPVAGYAVPKVPGWEDGACDELCKHNPEEAKKLFDESGYTGAVEITSNSDGGHKEWIEAACGQIEEALGVECKFVPVQLFGEIREKINAQEMTQIYRGGWLADYPLVENFLNPLYRTGGSSNDGGYSNPAVDEKLRQADAAATEEESFTLYHEAEELIAEDMPAIPLWNTPAQYGWSDRLKNVRMTPDRELDLSYVEMA